jgi:hypothetical protein
MIGALRRGYDRFRGAGAAAVTVPPMDGALRPNTVLDRARLLASLPAPDNLASDGRSLWLSSGAEVHVVADPDGAAKVSRWAGFERTVCALAVHGGGAMAVALAGKGIEIHGGVHDGRTLATVGDRAAGCAVALAFADADTLLVCLGSAEHRPEEWKRDLMSRGASGSIWRVGLAGGQAVCLADQLAFPFGVALRDGRVIFSESWRHHLVALDAGGKRSVLVDDLPGYPARLAAAAGGRTWLSVFAPRDQLIEFVLQERGFCDRMMREIGSDYWMAPALSSGRTFLEPLQGGAIRQLGMLKPWSPTRSYGLLVRLDESFRPVASFHSRADGKRHGITSAVEIGGRIIATSKGGDAVIALDADADVDADVNADGN